MEKCLGFGKSEKVMIRLRMGYVFSLRLRLSFLIPASQELFHDNFLQTFYRFLHIY